MHAVLRRKQVSLARAVHLPWQEALILAHHNLVMMLWGRPTHVSSLWIIHREISTASLWGIEVPSRLLWRVAEEPELWIR